MRHLDTRMNITQMTLTMIACGLCIFSLVCFFGLENRSFGMAAAGFALLAGTIAAYISLKLPDAAGFGILAVTAVVGSVLCVSGFFYLEISKITNAIDTVSSTYHTIRSLF